MMITLDKEATISSPMKSMRLNADFSRKVNKSEDMTAVVPQLNRTMSQPAIPKVQNSLSTASLYEPFDRRMRKGDPKVKETTPKKKKSSIDKFSYLRKSGSITQTNKISSADAVYERDAQVNKNGNNENVTDMEYKFLSDERDRLKQEVDCLEKVQ